MVFYIQWGGVIMGENIYVVNYYEERDGGVEGTQYFLRNIGAFTDFEMANKTLKMFKNKNPTWLCWIDVYKKIDTIKNVVD
jgi:hypothetical protein